MGLDKWKRNKDEEMDDNQEDVSSLLYHQVEESQ